MKLIRLICAVIFAIIIAGCTEKETQVEVSSVSLNTATIEMVEGETFNLVATVLPKDAEYDKVIWASSNASVARVNSGTVTAVKEGNATITASAGGNSSTCTVKVSAKVVPVTSIALDKTSLSMKVGETETITATVNPDNATDKSVTWGSSDVSVATVADGRVTAKKSGEATITAKSGSCIAECKVTITVSTETVTLDKTTLSLAVGESVQLTATVKPDDATDKNVSWTSSDESVVKVDNGKVSALKFGKATITAKCGGKAAECAVTVTVPTGSVTLDKTTLSLAVGESATLTAMVKPDDATDKTVIWTSSDESVAKVDNGKVTAVKAGKATITAKCGGKTAECAVTVTVPTGSVNLDKTALSLAVGETVQLTATVKPDDATDKNVAWTSSDESVAKVDNGKVTAIKAGNATVTAQCGGKTAKCIVTVIVPVKSITLDKSSLTMAVGETSVLTATVKPDNATDKTISWSSSDPSVVKVDNGKLTALKVGTAVVSVIAANFSASCSVMVNKPNNILYYTSSDGNVAIPFDETAFGAKILSNEYSMGMGRIIFDGPVTSIGRNAFYQNKTLKTIDLPETVSTIGDNAFNNCLELNAISIPESVASIGMAAFKQCHSLSEIDLPGNITVIEKETFYECWKLSNAKIPKKVKSIGEYAFYYTKIKTLDLPQGLQIIDHGAFLWCKNITGILIPGTVISIGQSAFQGCKSLVSVEIQEGVTVLSLGCFSDCPLLSTVRLPNSINKICDLVFHGCPVLSDLYLKANMPPEIHPHDVFGGNTGMNIWVPRASVDAYIEKWAKFKDNIKAYDF